ncbi:hypothetical protein DFH08DRAFT_621373, partial [Mycena albidolilacea]
GSKIIDCGDVPVDPFDNVLVVDQMEVAYSTLLSFWVGSHYCPCLNFCFQIVVRLHAWLLPILRAIHKKYGAISVIHFDGHLARLRWRCHRTVKVTRGIIFYLAQEEGLISNTSIHAGIRYKLGGAEDLENDEAVSFQLITTDDIDDLGISEITRLVRDRYSWCICLTSNFLEGFLNLYQEAGGWTTRELKHIICGLAGLKFV